MRSTSLAVLLIILVGACGESTSVSTTGGAGPSTTTTAATATTSVASIEDLRELAFAYWEAFNAYDPDRVLSYLEESYRTNRAESIRAEIRQIDTFGVQLGVEEESPPVMTGEDTAEMFLALKNPLGIKRIRMEFERIDGGWMITFAEETD